MSEASGSSKQQNPLIRHGRKGLFRVLFSRLGIIVLLLLIQASLLLFFYWQFEEYHPHLYTIMTVISIIAVFYLLNNGMDPSAKVTWLI